MKGYIGLCVLFTVLLLVVLPNFAVSIAGFVIAGIHWDGTCSDTAVVKLPIWLVVSGSISTGCLLVMVVGMIIGMMTEYTGVIYFTMFWLKFISGMFLVAWNILGALSLFMDSMNCRNSDFSLWAVTIATLVIQWVGIFGSMYSEIKMELK